MIPFPLTDIAPRLSDLVTELLLSLTTLLALRVLIWNRFDCRLERPEQPHLAHDIIRSITDGDTVFKQPVSDFAQIARRTVRDDVHLMPELMQSLQALHQTGDRRRLEQFAFKLAYLASQVGKRPPTFVLVSIVGLDILSVSSVAPSACDRCTHKVKLDPS